MGPEWAALLSMDRVALLGGAAGLVLTPLLNHSGPAPVGKGNQGF